MPADVSTADVRSLGISRKGIDPQSQCIPSPVLKELTTSWKIGYHFRVKKNVHYAQHGSVIRHVILKGVSAQIQSAIDRVDAGRPTALVSHIVVLFFKQISNVFQLVNYVKLCPIHVHLIVTWGSFY